MTAPEVPRPRVCIDASCVVSGAASPPGAAGAVLQLAFRARVVVFVTGAIAAEYEDALGRKSVTQLLARKGVTFTEASDRIARLVRLALAVKTVGEAPPCRDESDRMYLHCAVTADVDFLVTNDDDLLVEAGNHPFAIVRPAELLALLREAEDAG